MNVLDPLTGLLVWTLFEYVSHRFIAHWKDRFCAHHARPRDYSVGPSWAFIEKRRRPGCSGNMDGSGVSA